MKPETEEHLKKVEGAVAEANHILAQHDYPDNSRTVIVVGLLATMIEHHRAMLLLIRTGRVGSAFALARSIVESMYRGMWINACATDQQIQAFEADDKFPVNMPDMAKAIDEAYRAHGFCEDLRKRGWAALCSYTHSGMLQLGRRFREHKVQPNYDDREIYEATTTVTTCILLLAGKFLAYQNHVAECTAVEALVGIYGPAALVKPATPAAARQNAVTGTHYHAHDEACLRFVRESNGKVIHKTMDSQGYVPCAASFSYWPETLADWQAGKSWPVCLCPSCAVNHACDFNYWG